MFARHAAHEKLNFSDKAKKKEISYLNKIKDIKEKYIYEIKDVEKELENLTEDSDDIRINGTNCDKERYEIKKKIKIAFKRDLRPPEPDMEFYKLGRILGRGAFGKVNLALHKLSRQVVAVKSINKKIQHPQHLQKVHNEYTIMKKLRHTNVIKFFEKVELEKHTLFFMEMCQGGDLLSYIRKRRKLDENIAKYFFR